MPDHVLFCGSRAWSNFAAVRDTVKRLREVMGPFIVVQGCARGADQYARLAARVLGMQWVDEPADWATHGKGAGMIRNTKMLEVYKPVLVVAFWVAGSHGTADTLNKAINVYRTPTLIYTTGPLDH